MQVWTPGYGLGGQDRAGFIEFRLHSVDRFKDVLRNVGLVDARQSAPGRCAVRGALKGESGNIPSPQ